MPLENTVRSNMEKTKTNPLRQVRDFCKNFTLRSAINNSYIISGLVFWIVFVVLLVVKPPFVLATDSTTQAPRISWISLLLVSLLASGPAPPLVTFCGNKRPGAGLRVASPR